MLGRWVPPPRRPVRVMREYQLARHLAQRHQLTLAFVVDNPDATGPISALRNDFGDLEFAAVPRGWKSLSSAVRLATGESCTLSYFRSEALRTRLAERLSRTRYDLVFVSSSSMIQYALEVEASIPMVVDFGSVGSEWWVRQAARSGFPGARFFRAEATRLRMAEAAAARRASVSVADGSAAARIVESLAPGIRAAVIPSGVEVNEQAPGRRAGRRPTVVFNASLEDDGHLSKDSDFWRVVVSSVRRRIPEARFVITGRELGNGVSSDSRFVGCEVLGTIGDARNLYHDRTVVAAPLREVVDLRGSVLEAMAAGIPVVTTSRIRDELRARAGADVLVADAPAEFAQHLVELLEDGPRRNDLGAQGKRFAQSNFRWDIVGARLEELLAGVVKSHVRPESSARPIGAGHGG